MEALETLETHEARKDEKTRQELAEELEVHPNRISGWKMEPLDARQGSSDRAA